MNWSQAGLRVVISWRLGVLVGLVGWFVTGGAAAQVSMSRVSVRLAAPDECADDVRLVHRIEALLGQGLPDTDEGPSLDVRVSVQGGPDHGYAGKLSFTSAHGSEDRYLEHPNCDQLMQATALMIALAIDPERVHQTESVRAAQNAAPAQEQPPSQPIALPPPVVAPDPTTAPACEVRASSAPERLDPFRGMRLAVHGILGAGPLPKFGTGFEAVLGWHRQHFRAEILGRYWLSRRAPVSGAPSASLELGLATLGARGCWQPLRGVWQLAGCAGVDLGDLRGEGLGLENEHLRNARYSDVAAGFQIAYSRARLAPEAAVEIWKALERPRFGISENDSATQVFEPAAWAFSASFGLAFEL